MIQNLDHIPFEEWPPEWKQAAECMSECFCEHVDRSILESIKLEARYQTIKEQLIATTIIPIQQLKTGPFCGKKLKVIYDNKENGES